MSTPFTLPCLICTIRSELHNFPIFTNMSESGSISAGCQRMGSIPTGLQEGYRAAYPTHMPQYAFYFMASVVYSDTMCVGGLTPFYCIASVVHSDTMRVGGLTPFCCMRVGGLTPFCCMRVGGLTPFYCMASVVYSDTLHTYRQNLEYQLL